MISTNNIIDTHNHSTASGHAYSSLEEMAKDAASRGIPGFVLSDHSPGMPGSAHSYHFSNLRVLPRKIHGTFVFRGIEANIINSQGEIDIDEELCNELEVVIASLHIPTFPPDGKEAHTSAYIGAMKNPYVKIIGHPDDTRFPYDISRFVQAAGETGTIIEVNNSSLRPDTFRVGAEEVYKTLLKECRKQGVRVTLSSDSHFSASVGCVEHAARQIEEANFPEELIVNLSIERFLEEFGLEI
ncbi:MAG: phosphatase [Spirochaetales bacterium]|nr:phosphatase [Spirochaetales bacterium]